MLDNIKLKNTVQAIETEVFKDYLRDFSSYRAVSCSSNIDEWNEDRIRTIRISKFVRNPDDADIDNLCQLFQSFYGDECTIALLFRHTASGIELYLRIADTRDNVASSGTVNALSDRAKRVFSSVFPGADVSELIANDVFAPKSHIISVTNLAGEKNDHFISLEKLFDSNDGNDYSVLLLAKPINSRSQLNEQTQKLNDYLSVISEYEADQITKGKTNSTTKNANASIVFVSGGVSKSDSDSDSITKTHSNYTIKHMTSLISKSLERLDTAKSVGGWDFAAYVLSDDLETAKNIAHQYDAIVRGKESDGMLSAILPWQGIDAQNIGDFLLTNQHPQFVNDEDKIRDVTTFVTSLDLAHAMNFPRSSVPGFPVTECAAFGRSPVSLDVPGRNGHIDIGTVYHMRHIEESNKVAFDIDALSSHVFITGSTGSGKSNTVYQLLNKLINNTNFKKEKPHFLVVEPAKGEYRKAFGSMAKCYGTNCNKTDLLQINPFSFPEGVQLYSHLDRLVEIFNACWPMYAAMPAVLKDAIEQAYVEAGWNLQTSKNPYGRLFPTFIDVLRQIDIVMNSSDYSNDSKSDYKGALKTRLKSLTNGVYSQIFCFNEIDADDLFNDNVIVDLSELGPETTSLIMGFLILKLQEYRMAEGEMNSSLRHVTILEEAHNLLKRTSTEQDAESSNLAGKSVEMLTNAIAEMRTYGECFLIVDQAPGRLDPAVIRNTNTKIVLRLPDYSDRELVGRSIGLNDNQITELGKLERGVAAVYQSGWIEAVLCKFDKYVVEDEHTEEKTRVYSHDLTKDKTAILNALVIPGLDKTLRSLIWKSDFPVSIKIKTINSPMSKDTKAAIAYELFEANKLYATGASIQEETELSFVKQKLHIIVGNDNMDPFAMQLATLIRSGSQVLAEGIVVTALTKEAAK